MAKRKAPVRRKAPVPVALEHGDLDSSDDGPEIKEKVVEVEEKIVLKKTVVIENVTETIESNVPDRIEIRPIENRRRYHGLTTAKLDRPKKIRVLPNMTTMRYDIDLTDKEVDWLETKLGFPLILEYTPGVFNDSWDSNKFILKLTNEIKVLYTKLNPYDLIYYKSALKDDWVANSWEEWDSQEAYNAKFYIFDQFENSRKKATKVELLTAARKLSYQLSRLQKEQILRVYTENDYSNVSSNVIDVEIDEMINKTPSEFITFAQMNAGELHLRSIAIEAISTRIISKKTEGYYYRDMYLGADVPEITRYLSNPKNQGIKVSILDKLQKLK